MESRVSPVTPPDASAHGIRAPRARKLVENAQLATPDRGGRVPRPTRRPAEPATPCPIECRDDEPERTRRAGTLDRGWDVRARDLPVHRHRGQHREGGAGTP